MNWFFITVGYSGLFPKAPGTIGSLVSVFLALPILIYFGGETLFSLSILISLIAIKAIDKHEAIVDEHDDKRIVIDELVGMWIALSIAPATQFIFPDLVVWENGIAIQIILSFIFFIYFDITKPSLIGRIDRETKGGLGVVGDDVLAGFMGGIASAVLWIGIQLFL